jgi:hypothetical protein
LQKIKNGKSSENNFLKMKILTKNTLLIATVITFGLILTSCKKDPEQEPTPTSDEYAEAETKFADYFATAGNSSSDPGIGADLKVATSLTTLSPISGTFLQTANFSGAVDPTATPWYEGWSFLDNVLAGNMTDVPRTAPSITKTVKGDTVNGTGTVTWSKDTVYILDGFVFVKPGQVLTIQAGTVIKGKSTPSTGDNASALIVTRGAQIMAPGTAAEPIIFTGESDLLNGATQVNTSGTWGGVVILGKAPNNYTVGVKNIEGVPTSQSLAEHGGNIPTDNSGTFTYVSIRHGGAELGPDNEINGLTLGSVGSGTILNHIEIVGNKDDGIEWFGGTVNGKYLISLYAGDDALDLDDGYSGTNQFCIIYQNPASGESDKGFEHDGGKNTDLTLSSAKFYNVTAKGGAGSRAFNCKENAGGEYHNSIFYDFAAGITVEYTGEEKDAFNQFNDGKLKFENNIFFNIASGTTGADLFKLSDSRE